MSRGDHGVVSSNQSKVEFEMRDLFGTHAALELRATSRLTVTGGSRGWIIRTMRFRRRRLPCAVGSAGCSGETATVPTDLKFDRSAFVFCSGRVISCVLLLFDTFESTEIPNDNLVADSGNATVKQSEVVANALLRTHLGLTRCHPTRSFLAMYLSVLKPRAENHAQHVSL